MPAKRKRPKKNLKTKKKTKKKTKIVSVRKAKPAVKMKRKAVAPAKRMIAPRAAPPAKAGPTPAKQINPSSMHGILHPGAMQAEPGFRDAPEGWTRAQAEALAAKSGLRLVEDVWEVIRVLQGSYKDEVSPRLRLLRDALEARFAAKGGMKYLYRVLPGGPIAQGCALAGLKPPQSATDHSFGSVA
jgi:tRNA 2-thiouridine synthesizing protein E